MKRIIVSSSQVPYLKEETTTLQITAPNNNAGDALARGKTQAQIQNAQTTFGGSNITAQITPEDGPGDSTITIPNSKGGTNGAAEAIKDNSTEVQKALSSGLNVGVDVSESKVFTKKTIEEARLAKIRKEGRVLTKQQIFEGFIAESNIADEIGGLSVFDVLNAYEAVGGDVQGLSTVQDMIGTICDKYIELDPESQHKFMAIARGKI